MELLVAKIGLGTAQFGQNYGISNSRGRVPMEEVAEILEHAWEQGIDTLDTASAYGNAQRVLGKIGVDKFQIVSKYMPPKDMSIEGQLKETLEELQVERLYGFLAHQPSDLLDSPEQWNVLQHSKKKGYIEKIGFSLYDTGELDSLLSFGLKPDLIQVPFNLIDNRFKEWMVTLKREGCEIHARSPFLQGLFFMKPDSLPSFFDELKPFLESIQRYDNLPKLLLNYVAKKSFIDEVIVGFNSLHELKNSISTQSTEDFNIEVPEIPKKILNPTFWP
ncbi:MAG: aldo/keto reductase [Flavobacteriales bacterium]